MDAEACLAAATLRLVISRPYLAVAACGLRRVPCPGIGTMGVDHHWRLYYDPATIAEWTVEELSGVIYHELCHLLREHPERAPIAVDTQLWNIAADAEINDGLRDEGVRLPGAPIYPATIGQPDGLLAEAYYRALEQQPLAPTTGREDPTADTTGRASADRPGVTASRPAATAVAIHGKPTVVNASRPADFGVETTRVCAGRCGSAATGVEAMWERSAKPVDGWPEGLTQSEAVVLRHQVAEAIRAHAATVGTVPGHWIRWANARVELWVDWRRELAASVRRMIADVAGTVDYSYRRLSRRQPALGPVILPALRHPVPRIAVVVDTSGSMTNDMIHRAVAEVGAILRAAGQREAIEVLAVDAAVHDCRRVFRADQVRLIGGGGTDMRVGLAAAAALRPPVDLVVVITDGFTPWPERRPQAFRTVIVLTDSRGAAPTWARAILAVEAARSGSNNLISEARSWR